MSELNGSSEQHPVKVERFQRNLRNVLTDREIVERARRAAHLASEVEQLEEEKKAAAKQAQARIEEVQAEQRRLNLEVADGAVHRETPCERRYIYRTGVVVEVRTDTGETLSERPMTDRERQPDLPGVDPVEASDDGIVDDDYEPDGLTEEQREEFVETGTTGLKLETEKKPKAKAKGRRRAAAESEAE